MAYFSPALPVGRGDFDLVIEQFLEAAQHCRETAPAPPAQAAEPLAQAAEPSAEEPGEGQGGLSSPGVVGMDLEIARQALRLAVEVIVE